MYLGDFATGETVHFKWNTTQAGVGSVTRATDGSIRIYKDGSATQRTSANGITDTEDFDSLTGVHHLTIDLSDNTDAGFYAAGSDYQVVLQGAVIGGETINAALAHFSIENRNDAVDLQQIDGDTGPADNLGRIAGDTGQGSYLYRHRDTGGIADAVWSGDTGLRDAIASVDTGLRDLINDTDTGLRAFIDDLDTGIKNRFNDLAEDTGGVTVTAFSDTGINDRLAKILGDTDTGIRVHIDRLDTGAMVILDKLQFDTGANELHADVRKVNNVQVQGVGAGANKWRPV